MILCGYFGDTTRNGRGGENEREEPGAEADTSWKFEDLWQSPIGDISHASNFRSACTAYPPLAESTTASELLASVVGSSMAPLATRPA
jgi:hypothetical protein